MSKKLTKIGAIFLGLYLVLWSIMIVILHGIKKELNQYANQPLSFFKQDLTFSFQKVQIKYLALIPQLQIIGFQEASAYNILEYHAPITIGYNFALEKLYMKYSGGSILRIKPLESGFNYKLTYNLHHYMQLPRIKDLWQVWQNHNMLQLLSKVRKMQFSLQDFTVVSANNSQPLLTFKTMLCKAASTNNLSITDHTLLNSYQIHAQIIEKKIINRRKLPKLPISLLHGYIHHEGAIDNLELNCTVSEVNPNALAKRDFSGLKFSGDFQLSSPTIKINLQSTNEFSRDPEPLVLQSDLSGTLATKPYILIKGLEVLESIFKKMNLELEFLGKINKQLTQQLKLYRPSLRFNTEVHLLASKDLKKQLGEIRIQDSKLLVESSTLPAKEIRVARFTHQLDKNWQTLHSSGTVQLAPSREIIDNLIDWEIIGAPLQTSLAKSEIKQIYQQVSDIMCVNKEPKNDQKCFSYSYLAVPKPQIQIGNLEGHEFLKQYREIVYNQVATLAAQAPNFLTKFQELAPDLYVQNPELVRQLKAKYKP